MQNSHALALDSMHYALEALRQVLVGVDHASGDQDTYSNLLSGCQWLRTSLRQMQWQMETQTVDLIIEVLLLTQLQYHADLRSPSRGILAQTRSPMLKMKHESFPWG